MDCGFWHTQVGSGDWPEEDEDDSGDDGDDDEFQDDDEWVTIQVTHVLGADAHVDNQTFQDPGQAAVNEVCCETTTWWVLGGEVCPRGSLRRYAQTFSNNTLES